MKTNNDKINNVSIGALPSQIIPLFVIVFLWLLAFYQGLSTAVKVWQVSEIFTHCFLVIPCSVYFIFQKRQRILSQPWLPNYWLLPAFVGLLFIQLFGSVGDIQLFMHIATFTSLPLMIWMVIGNKAAKEICFPLAFMLFSIPVGEQLIPYLQIITTDMAVPLLELSNVPIYRNGFYLDIPQGRFLVAEACSGISFLIASIVFGCFYAYLSFSTLSKQIIFVMLSILIPIIANALRVYGIVLTAHLTDMEYAAGADHIIYGGIFYTIILFILIIIGENFRDQPLAQKAVSEKTASIQILVKMPKMMFFIITCLALQLFWKATLDRQVVTNNIAKSVINLQQLPLTNTVLSNAALEKSQWQPLYVDADDSERGVIITSAGLPIDYYIASYLNSEAELISSLNVLYSNKKWAPLSQQTHYVSKMNAKVILTKIVSPVGQHRYIVHWYQLANEIHTSQIKVKLLQTKAQLFGGDSRGTLFAFSLQNTGEEALTSETLLAFLTNNAEHISKIIELH